ncbi:metal-dependent hydrolase [Subtercola boreus]|uniref:Metal-dependent hydrolase n=1 Tax=Subtercola boreus TaxID=120213 RepID=A0A3E0VN16_9MICO|nr:amidohydrolase family protein [Subtercola boreus]RFA10813.1 metal-dependent hydrolase [Subtercola boreus]TQL55611.1 L-fuconolactonase [Subtercola boreus]
MRFSVVTVDSHQHVWNPERVRYDWLEAGMPELDRIVDFAELRPSLQAAGVDATVLVQSADNDGDTDWMLAVAAANPEVAGVVAYVPLDRPDEAAARLTELRRNPLVVGVRNLIHDQPDPDWMLQPAVDEGLALLEAASLPFDYVAVLPRHLENLPGIGERHPELTIVIDHLAKPPIGGADREPWWSLIERVAENPRVMGKVSGLYSAVGDPAGWDVAGVRPFVDRAFDVFGADRLMYGGDWPVSLLAGGYARVWSGLADVLATATDDSGRTRVYGGTAEQVYGLDLQKFI